MNLGDVHQLLITEVVRCNVHVCAGIENRRCFGGFFYPPLHVKDAAQI